MPVRRNKSVTSSPGSGGLRWKPCPRSQPCSTRNRSCPSFSAPSASKPLVPPLAELPADLLQDPVADLLDQPELLRERDEVVRLDQRTGSPPPPDQRLEGHHPSRRQLHQRLVVQHPLLPGHRLPEASGQGQPVDARVVLQGVAHRAAGSRALAPVH